MHKFFIVIFLSFFSVNLNAEVLMKPKKMCWPFEGVLGKFDRAALQRGFQVYKEVCSACHSLKHIRFRELSALGFSEAEIKAIAAAYSFDTLNDDGEKAERKGESSDSFPSPFPNDRAARAAHGGALPPDLSLIIKARPHGPDYVHALLTGYGQKPPEGFVVAEGRYYNPYMNGGQIAMPPPLTQDGLVTYSDGTVATVDQMAKDVVTFLTWASEPEMEERKRLGFAVIIYLLIMTGVFFLAMRKIWKGVK